ncbi:DHHW family protein [Paenibacillus sp. N3/727]|uniref:DHHW family protein n=1 Tax=Paenibacillus sp. N3/727 TaxID=2925845 RepID=UPI001F530AC9|nr:DHHW family protein [Paenibacillus sp. N3/727]UNK21144.1 DHHW family protein [Paenibacillus sp. N3/727]
MENYKNIKKKLLALFLLLFISVIAVLNLLAVDRSFSESENRMLEQLPHFSLKALVSGDFTVDFEKYVSDQFVFRDFWIGAKTDTDRLMGKKESNGIYLGTNGYLFQEFIPPAEEDLKEEIDAIHAFDQATPELQKYVMLVPTAAALYKDMLPKYAIIGDQEAYLKKVQQLLHPDIRFIDVFPSLYAERDQPIFYKTDHHWTTQGAYVAYLELCRQMGLTPQNEEEFNIKQVTDEFYGSLFSKSGFRHVQPDRMELYLPKDQEKYTVTYVDEGKTTDSLYAMEQLQKKDKYALFLNGNHALIQIKTANTNGRKLLVVKDSYANSLISFLLKHFSEINVVDLRYYEEDLVSFVNEHGIQDMLLLYNANTFFEDPSIKNLTE